MLKKTFISSLYVIPATVAVILFATHLWTPNFLITPPQLSGFEQQIELSISVFLVPLFSFILPNKFEIELGLVNGYSTMKLTLSKAFPLLIYSLLTTLIMSLIYQYTPYNITTYKSLFPIYVPENFRMYTLISVFVTLVFFSSICFFFRVLTRNCFLPILFDLLFITIFTNESDSIRKGFADIRVCLIDPFITTYFVGNTIPNSYAEKYSDLSLIKNAWTVNRIFFLTLSLVFLAATVFLLRREKLHRGMGE